MHRLLQGLDKRVAPPGKLEPLSQMRRTNEKLVDVASIEVVTEALGQPHVV